MADPRAFFSKKATPISTSNGLEILRQARQVLKGNNPAAARVSAGLKVLSSISKAVGAGGKLPVSIDDMPANIRWVLSQVGITTQSVFKVGQTNNAAVKAVQNVAQSIFSKVSTGTFTNKDFPQVRPPLDTFHELANKVYEPLLPRMEDITVSPYAMDLFAHAPKFKFLFVVQFTFNDPYQPVEGFQKQFAFMVQKSSRPNIKYVQDDVNYYNFRTTVTTKATFDEMTMQFYDDKQNTIAAFYAAYTQAMSPVLNYKSATEAETLEDQGITGTGVNGTSKIQGDGFTNIVPITTGNASSTNALADNKKTILREIKLYHVYDYGLRANIYTFINPRITSMELDEVDMYQSDVNKIDIKFNYETVATELHVDMMTGLGANIEEMTTSGKYPLRNIGGTQPSQTNPFDYVPPPEGGNYGSVNAIGEEFIHPNMNTQRASQPGAYATRSVLDQFDPPKPNFEPIRINKAQGQIYVESESPTSMFGTKG